MTDTHRPAVAICIVTLNAAQDLPRCFTAISHLRHRPLQVVLVDCASSDDTLEVARQCRPQGVPTHIEPLAENLGFAGGMNTALVHTTAPFVLSLNADAWPEPDFVCQLLRRAEGHADRRVGAVTGRLRRPRRPPEPPRLDACGMRLTLSWRHLDRGSSRVDRGQFPRPARVFGATGAATLFRREALDDVAVDGETFDRDFHSFREDAELCFRLRERDWEILYEPSAVATHRRLNLPRRRRTMPPHVNYHSLKNRYLLRFYHQTLPNLGLTILPTLLRDLSILAYVLARERSSLRAYRWLWHERAAILKRRRLIQARRTVPASAIDPWFVLRERPL
jgi:GT2 family glycosyltransferase